METTFLEFCLKTKIQSWDFISVPETDVRIFYNPREDKNGFNFYSIERTSYHDDDNWVSNDHVECVCYGVAYFDGIRHLYYGHEETNNYGYHYYPNIKMITTVLEYLEKLELFHCNKTY